MYINFKIRRVFPMKHNITTFHKGGPLSASSPITDLHDALMEAQTCINNQSPPQKLTKQRRNATQVISALQKAGVTTLHQFQSLPCEELAGIPRVKGPTLLHITEMVHQAIQSVELLQEPSPIKEPAHLPAEELIYVAPLADITPILLSVAESEKWTGGCHSLLRGIAKCPLTAAAFLELKAKDLEQLRNVGSATVAHVVRLQRRIRLKDS